MRSIALTTVVVVLAAAGCITDAEGESLASKTLMLSPHTPVYYNHALGVFSAETIDALQSNAYLNETFIDVEVRTTVRPDITYTGTYLNTRVTYFEAFVEGMLDLGREVCQVALSSEVAGSSEWVLAQWNDEFGDDQTEIPIISRQVNGTEVPWFRAVVPGWANTSQTTGTFHMEYVPNPGSDVPRTRLEERAGRYDPDKLAQDVQAVMFAVPATDRDLLHRSLVAVGWETRSWNDGFVAVSPRDHGSRRAVVVETAKPDRAGLLGVLFKLNRYDSHTEQLGDAVLRVGILHLPYAVLWFVPSAPNAEAELVSALRL